VAQGIPSGVTQLLTSPLLSPDDLALALRAIGAERYHNLHPFHRLLHGGRLTRGQVQAWALNRYYYQASIPAKDATLLARLPNADLRREWRRRLVDHDGEAPGTGGVARWLRLAEGVGLDPAYVESGAGILPATRFAVDAYVAFVRERSVLEAVASSLTELFSPHIIAERVSGMLANYDWITQDTLAYFTPRLTQAPKDSDFALAYVQEHARTVEQQQAVLDALRFKCDVLWAQLDALHHAYVAPATPPPGAFVPAGS
jgi:pyrroloquinoline-quinone synthase